VKGRREGMKDRRGGGQVRNDLADIESGRKTCERM